MTSIVIPAHNEERVLGRLLDALSAGPPDGEDAPDVVVVCNGCTDGTARIARAHPGVRVVEIPTPSKHLAMRTGDEHARGFPRLYVDADVVLGPADVRALAAAVDGPGPVLAAAPARELPLKGCGRRVRAYYRVWTRLPAVREGLFGRGVIALSEEGHARIAALPPLMADDLAASLAFAPGERRVVETARVVVHPPRTWRDLMKRRIRAAVSSAQVEQHQAARPPASPASAASPAGELPPSARTSTADLRALLRREPWLLPHLVLFLAAAVLARRAAAKAIRAQDYGTWLRDESSRAD
ncbi:MULTISPECIES: glycosyltransferase family 2 protein [unclassified Streptomyces]|uniref:glycosyltransferase family 2 protein n=1 Tax=unclassified Streptomyces TaxID=2593676 RepID=UPI002E2CCE55|nr:glycosyltransferase family 2 protein [Streptomyces sp. NBC_00223]